MKGLGEILGIKKDEKIQKEVKTKEDLQKEKEETDKKVIDKCENLLIGQQEIESNSKGKSFKIFQKKKFDFKFMITQAKTLRDLELYPVVYFDEHDEIHLIPCIAVDNHTIRFYCNGQLIFKKVKFGIPINYYSKEREIGFLCSYLVPETMNISYDINNSVKEECLKVNKSLKMIMIDYYSKAFADIDSNTIQLAKYALIAGLIAGVGVGFIIRTMLK